MKYLLATLWVTLSVTALVAQEQILLDKGEVSFVSRRNIYVRFPTTQNIEVGDTLYIEQAGELVPSLVVDNKSSASTVCSVLGDLKLQVKDEIVSRKIVLRQSEPKVSEELVEALPEENTNRTNEPVVTPEEEDPTEAVLFKEKIKGRVSVASYSSLSDFQTRHRMRYAFSFRGYNLKDSRFSTETYITFRHTLNDSISIRDALKVYSLNVKYDFSKHTHLTVGRKINPKFSSMGAIDGAQFETGWGRFSAGAIVGTRPDFRDYSFNANLLQFGAYLSFGSSNPSKFANTTVGVIEQLNAGNTDRRFLYLQHSSTLTKNLHFFGSAEVDLYEKINSEVKNNAQLTNLFFSLRYRISNKFRITASYDNRKNIIYYESYKSFLDQLIEDETRQGFRLGFTHRPFKRVTWGMNGNMRFQKSRQNPSRNASAFVAISRVPFIKARVRLRATYLDTDYLQSRSAGVRVSKELVKGKLNAEIYYRWVDYKYVQTGWNVHQDIGGASLSYRIRKDLSLHLFYEGVFDQSRQNNFQRINARIIKRF